jgi:hypothetical protein
MTKQDKIDGSNSVLGAINRRELEDLLVTYLKLRGTGISEQEIRKYAELIVDLVKVRGIASLSQGKRGLLVRSLTSAGLGICLFVGSCILPRPL